MRVTLKDIAKEAGVSVSMVSYVLNKTGRIVSDKHKRVIEIARKYNYVPDANARGLVTGINNNVGLVVPQQTEKVFSQPFMIKCISELSRNLSENSGWLSLCLGSDLSAASMRKYLGNAKLDGIIIMFTEDADDIAEIITSKRIPCIFFDRASSTGDASNIACDDYVGIRMAFAHLFSLGHRKILFLSGLESAASRPIDRRTAAYTDSVRQNGLDYHAILYGNYTKRGGYQAVKQFLESGENLPDAIIAANDRMAWGALRYLGERGIRVPWDVSVIGFDDADEEYNNDVGLSTIRQPIAQMAKYCVDYIYECIDTGELRHVDVKMEPELVIRNSTRTKPSV